MCGVAVFFFFAAALLLVVLVLRESRTLQLLRKVMVMKSARLSVYHRVSLQNVHCEVERRRVSLQSGS